MKYYEPVKFIYRTRRFHFYTFTELSDGDIAATYPPDTSIIIFDMRKRSVKYKLFSPHTYCLLGLPDADLASGNDSHITI